MNCGRCGAPLSRSDSRFCTRCGAPVGQAASGQQGGPPPYGQPVPSPYERPGYQSPYRPPPSRSSAIGPILVGAALVLAILGGIAYWALSTIDNPPISLGQARTPTPVPTSTSAPGLGINIPGLGAAPGAGAPSLPIPGLGNRGGDATPPPGAKLSADQARQKVKDSLQNCRVLHVEIDAAQVTFDPPTWHIRLPLSGATWSVDDATGAVTADDRATQRARTCR
jgi:hypothetical protein